ncbi:translation initiation factor IF-2 [Desulfococcaceae bacterium HSG9]|nr:translation initiation factor IF-2 [Desulfococcaceae bacterium HSG9]
MAKIRIYELARELNMQNKALLQKLRSLKISAKSHMSSLDDEAAAKVKAALFGKDTEQIVETRVRSTIIRRRTKPVVRKKSRDKKPVPEAEEMQAEPDVVSSAPETVIETVQSVESEPKEEAQVAEASENKKALTKKRSVKRKKRKLRKKTKAEQSAKIISKPQSDDITTSAPALSELSAESQDNQIKTTSLEEKAELIPTPVVPSPDKPVSEQPDSDKIKQVSPAPAPTPATDAELIKDPKHKRKAADSKEAKPKIKTAKTSKRKRKKNKKLKNRFASETPAKIIKLGEGTKITSDTKEKRTSRPKYSKQASASNKAASNKPSYANRKGMGNRTEQSGNKAVSTPAHDKKNFSKSKPDQVSKDKKFFKKKIAFRKKAVVEGKDLYGGRKKGRKARKWQRGRVAAKGLKTQITVAKAIKRRIKIDDAIILSELAKRMGIKANEMIKTLMDLGVMATVNQTIDFDTATLVAAEFDYEVEKASFEEENILKVEEDDPDNLVTRSPVVTIMGHVDHGKTTLLDTIRQSKITDGEAGGITQHIGAYLVNSTSESYKGQIVFLDTPGHEAFTEMRYRGASVTDIVVLIVAADDGVMPQTIEAINHAKAADVPIIVVVNKIDKPDAQPERVQRELAEAGLTPEDWGGDTIFVQASAKQGKGIDTLLEMILLQAELAELTANPDKLAYGHVIEAKLDSGRGPVATVLVQNGTLSTGQPVVCGMHYGKIRALLDDSGEMIQSAGPSTPVEIIGLAGVPNAGDELMALDDEKNARQVSAHRIQKQRAKELASSGLVSLDNLFDRIKDDDIKELNIILKADVQGSIEALKEALLKLSNEEVKINIIHSATGAIIESDVSLGAVSDAIIIGFNVRPNPKVQTLATEENVEIRSYNVIYNVIQEVQNAIVGMMASIFNEHVLGRAEIRDTFHIPKIGSIAGCIVSDGKIKRGARVRLLRDDIVIYEGKISSLRRFKDDVKEVQRGYECGIGIEKYNDVKIGDAIECYYIEETRPELET